MLDPIITMDGHDIVGLRACTIIERFKELNVQFDMLWFNYDLREEINKVDDKVSIILSTKGMSVFIRFKIKGFDDAMRFVNKLNFDHDPGLDLSQLWLWMRGRQTEAYGCIKEDTHE